MSAPPDSRKAELFDVAAAVPFLRAVIGARAHLRAEIADAGSWVSRVHTNPRSASAAAFLAAVVADVLRPSPSARHHRHAKYGLARVGKRLPSSLRRVHVECRRWGSLTPTKNDTYPENRRAKLSFHFGLPHPMQPASARKDSSSKRFMAVLRSRLIPRPGKYASARALSPNEDERSTAWMSGYRGQDGLACSASRRVSERASPGVYGERPSTRQVLHTSASGLPTRGLETASLRNCTAFAEP